MQVSQKLTVRGCSSAQARFVMQGQQQHHPMLMPPMASDARANAGPVLAEALDDHDATVQGAMIQGFSQGVSAASSSRGAASSGRGGLGGGYSTGHAWRTR